MAFLNPTPPDQLWVPSLGVPSLPFLRSDCFVSWARSGLPFDIEPSNRFLLGLPSTSIVDCLYPTSVGVLAGLALRAANRLAGANDARAALARRAARLADKIAGSLAPRRVVRRALRSIDRADRRWARIAVRALIRLGDVELSLLNRLGSLLSLLVESIIWLGLSVVILLNCLMLIVCRLVSLDSLIVLFRLA